MCTVHFATPDICTKTDRPHLHLQAFRALWSNPRLLNIMEQLLGTEDIMGHPVWNLRTKTPQNEATTVPWHQGKNSNPCVLWRYAPVSTGCTIKLYLSPAFWALEKKTILYQQARTRPGVGVYKGFRFPPTLEYNY